MWHRILNNLGTLSIILCYFQCIFKEKTLWASCVSNGLLRAKIVLLSLLTDVIHQTS